MTFLLKIKFESTLRRLLVEEGLHGEPDLTFARLEAKIRDMFQVSWNDKLVITYSDQDNDVVTMGSDHDLYDACIVQKLNPVRLEVKVENFLGSREDETLIGSPPDCGVFKDVKPVERPLIEWIAANWGLDHANDKVEQLPGDRVSSLDTALPRKVLSEVVEGLLKMAKGEVNSGLPGRSMSTRHMDATHHTSNTSSAGESTDQVAHRGVQCDMCGMMPIIGSRFNSIKKENYDLCSVCFLKFGNETDYRKVDKPIHSRSHHHHPWQRGRTLRHPIVPPPRPLKPCFERGNFSWKDDHATPLSIGCNPKLDARFVQDITIFDGTEVAVGTNFTKIWRLRNIGTLPWPRLTQLVHVGGDVLGSDKPSILELPEEGLLCDKEIDASVDLVAPDKPGRYIAHWRLMAPSGQKFGQRVWVLIQVVPRSEPVMRGDPAMVESSPEVTEIGKSFPSSQQRMQETIADRVVGDSDWEHMIEELEEMGFYDAKTNRRLLSENNGSIKLVVKELLQMQKVGGEDRPMT